MIKPEHPKQTQKVVLQQIQQDIHSLQDFQKLQDQLQKQQEHFNKLQEQFNKLQINFMKQYQELENHREELNEHYELIEIIMYETGIDS